MDKESFSMVILNATDELYRVSKAILKNDYDCEDAVQEAIAKAFEKLGTLRQEKYAKWNLFIRQNFLNLANAKKNLMCYNTLIKHFISIKFWRFSRI